MGGQLIRVPLIQRLQECVTRTQGSITDQSMCPSFFLNFLSSFALPPTVSLDHALQSSSHDLREWIKEKKRKQEEKWVRATYFFPHSSRRQRVAVLSSVRRGAGPDGEAGPCRETQPLRTGSAAEATSCKRLVIPGEKSCK